MDNSLRSHTLPGIPPLPKKRGRPVTGYALTAGERKAKSRALHDVVVLSVELPSELVQQFNDFLQFKGKTKNEVIAGLLRNQLLRKR